MDRVILHCDCNSYYASVETLLNPALRDVPMAVAGDPDSRHGIILAKNEWAKKYGVQTAETIWQARQKCPNLVCVAPHHDKYSELSREINRIYLDYTDLVDPFGIDESFLDLTGVMKLHKKTPLELAHEIRLRVKREQGITISVGVSFCRVFAKLGSDYKKPDAVTVFSPDNWQERVWPLPASALLFVGRRTAQMLEQHGIHTIGDLAAADRLALGQWLGKQGDTLWRYANGLDREPVRPYDAPRELKSVGNGMTFRRDLVGEAEIRCGVAALCDSVAARLRAHGLKCATVQVQLKTPSFRTISRQKPLSSPSYLQKVLTDTAMELILANWNLSAPVRLITITGCDLVPADVQTTQLSLFPSDEPSQKKQEAIEDTMAQIRARFGRGSIGFGYFDNEELGIHRKKSKPDK